MSKRRKPDALPARDQMLNATLTPAAMKQFLCGTTELFRPNVAARWNPNVVTFGSQMLLEMCALTEDAEADMVEAPGWGSISVAYAYNAARAAVAHEVAAPFGADESIQLEHGGLLLQKALTDAYMQTVR